MPIKQSVYPKSWNAIAKEIKTAAAWKCEECGKQCKRKDESWGQFFSTWNMQSNEFSEAIKHTQRFVLAVAHLNKNPLDSRPENLKALCGSCHARYHFKQIAVKKRLKLERMAQFNFFG